jgi:hypothetical protein
VDHAGGDELRPGQGRGVDDEVGAQLAGGPAHAVAEEQPALGVGVVDLDGLARVHAQDVVGLVAAGRDRVLGDRQDQRQPVARPLGGQHPERAQDRGRAAHVRLHALHEAALLQVQPAGVEGDALADQGDVARSVGRADLRDQEPRRLDRGLADAEDAAQAARRQLVADVLGHRDAVAERRPGRRRQRRRVQLRRRRVDQDRGLAGAPHRQLGPRVGHHRLAVGAEGRDRDLDLGRVGLGGVGRDRPRHRVGRGQQMRGIVEEEHHQGLALGAPRQPGQGEPHAVGPRRRVVARHRVGQDRQVEPGRSAGQGRAQRAAPPGLGPRRQLAHQLGPLLVEEAPRQRPLGGAARRRHHHQVLEARRRQRPGIREARPWPWRPWPGAPRRCSTGPRCTWRTPSRTRPCPGSRPQRRREAEHLGQRHLGVDLGEAVLLGRADHDAAALHDERQHVAGELGRALERHLHDRLEDLGARALEEVAEGAAGGLLEGDVRRVDRVGRRR